MDKVNVVVVVYMVCNLDMTDNMGMVDSINVVNMLKTFG